MGCASRNKCHHTCIRGCVWRWAQSSSHAHIGCTTLNCSRDSCVLFHLVREHSGGGDLADLRLLGVLNLLSHAALTTLVVSAERVLLLHGANMVKNFFGHLSLLQTSCAVLKWRSWYHEQKLHRASRLLNLCLVGGAHRIQARTEVAFAKLLIHTWQQQKVQRSQL